MMPEVLGTARALAATGRISAATLALVVVDDERRCLETNLAACRMVGRSREDVLTGSFDDLLAESMHGRLANVWKAFVENGGHAGPFELAARGEAAGSVDIDVTPSVLPGRHLLVLTPAGQQGAAPVRRSSAPRRPRAPERPAPRPSATRGPTSREREILALLASGSTDGQIAAQLDLSPATVQTHVRNAKAKLGARTRAQAVALAIQRGLIETYAPRPPGAPAPTPRCGTIRPWASTSRTRPRLPKRRRLGTPGRRPRG